jgi:hypothetical protein
VEKQDPHSSEHDSSPAVPERRSTYVTPALVEYGKVSKLTEGTASAGNDSGPMTKNRMCL